MKGRAFVFGDEINTDIIAPLGADYSRDDLVANLMAPVRPGFTEEIEGGEIIVAGEHFGSGSSRETAPTAIQEAGIAAVVAESFSRIYYRNSVNIGLPAIACPGISENITEGDEVEIDFEESVVRNLTTGEEYPFDPIAEELQDIFEAGGLLEYYHASN